MAQRRIPPAAYESERGVQLGGVIEVQAAVPVANYASGDIEALHHVDELYLRPVLSGPNPLPGAGEGRRARRKIAKLSGEPRARGEHRARGRKRGVERRL